MRAALTYNSASFDWSSTTPLSDVGSYIQNAFWNCGKDFSLISSRGFVPLENVRVSPDDLSFVEELPIVPEPLLQFGLIKRLRAGDVLSDVQIEDIVTILEKSKKTRTPVQLVSQKHPPPWLGTDGQPSNNFLHTLPRKLEQTRSISERSGRFLTQRSLVMKK